MWDDSFATGSVRLSSDWLVGLGSLSVGLLCAGPWRTRCCLTRDDAWQAKAPRSRLTCETRATVPQTRVGFIDAPSFTRCFAVSVDAQMRHGDISNKLTRLNSSRGVYHQAAVWQPRGGDADDLFTRPAPTYCGNFQRHAMLVLLVVGEGGQDHVASIIKWTTHDLDVPLI